MPLFTVPYIGADGSRRRISVFAEDAADAIRASEISEQAILTEEVKENRLYEIWERLQHPPPKRSEQTLFLNTIATMIEVGRPLRGIDEIAARYKSIRPDSDALQMATSVPDTLRACRIEDSAVLLAEVGEKSNSTASALRQAADGMEEMERIRGQLGKALIGAGIKLLVGLGLIIAMPMVFGTIFSQMAADAGVSPEGGGLAYQVLTTLYAVYTNGWPFVVLGAVGAIVSWPLLWKAFRKYPPLSFINDMLALNRGLLFVASFRPLYEAGIPAPTAVRLIMRQESGKNAKIYSNMLERLDSGETISDVLASDEEWPDDLRTGFIGFELATNEARERIFNSTVDLLDRKRQNAAAKVANIAGAVGLIMIVSGILLAALGGYLPMMNMQNDMGR